MIKNIGIFKDFHDGTLKSVFDIGDNKIIEMSLLFNRDKTDVVCVPTHHFCNMGCKMCHLTNKGLNKCMEKIKPDDFINALISSVKKGEKRRTNNKNLLISFMGVGEPLLNLELIEEVYKKEKFLKETLGYENIGYALSTMMPNDISKLKEMVLKFSIPLKIHFSLHNPIDKKRKELIPNSKVNVKEALSNLNDYRGALKSNKEIMTKYLTLHRTKDPVEIHYTLINGVNDGEEELKELCDLSKEYLIPIKFIRFNPVKDLEKSENEEKWVLELLKTVPTLQIKTYSPPGKEVGSSCGEFTKHYYHEEIETEEEKLEFLKWKTKHQVFENQNSDNLNWDEYFMAIAKLTAMRSKDPSTQVGACIVSQDNRILSIGYNGTPNGYLDECFPWQREGDALNTKYMYVVHAERNAILNYRGYRRDFENAKIYVDLFPCNECAKEIIQSGIKEVIYLSDKYATTESIIASKKLMDVCGVKYRQLDKKNQKRINIDLKLK